jgi:hypothetical protein
MKSRKFNHFQIFKLVIISLYVASGSLVFSMTISNAKEEFRQSEDVQIDASSGATEYIDCMNCDEID